MQNRIQTIQARCKKSFILEGRGHVHRGDIVTISKQLFRVFFSAGLVEEATAFPVSEPESPKKGK